MTSLPFDVLMEILPLIEFTDLTVIARTNKDLSGYALDRLYGHITSRNMKARPRSRHRIYPPVLRDALRITLNLRTLKLDIDGKHSWVLTPALGVFKLRSFSSFTYADEALINFLHDQTELEEIALTHSCFDFGPRIPWEFPNLKKFDGPMSWVDIIIPHNPVSHVVVSSIASGGAITSLGLTAAPINHLEIPIRAMHGRDFMNLRALLPDLKELVLVILPDWSRNNGIPDLASWLRDLLASFSNVNTFRLSGYYSENNWQEDSHFVKKATEQAPAVRSFCLKYSNRMVTGRFIVNWAKRTHGWEAIAE
ncbi:hypothetical protein C8R44DRAFT_991104 [Mycena epipterygia]|nr:hypothetical protein C8R44DRAFT_991104 [Mycena epipterygia]